MSFYTSLSGLKGAQTELGTVSNNIANVGSYGFKKSRTDFGDIISSSRTTPGNGTRLKSIEQQFSQGGFEATSRELDLAIAGAGFFVTRDAVSGGNTLFTRNGKLALDADRYLVDSNGAYVQALPVDPEGNVTATGLASATSLQIPESSGIPRATSTIDLAVSLPSSADLPASRPMYSATSPYAFDRLDPNSYNHSVQTTVYDSDGDAIPATMYFVRTGSATPSTWEAHLFVGNDEVSADPAAATQPAPLQMEFDAAGVRTLPAGPITYDAVTPSGASAPLTITLDLGSTDQAAGPFTLRSVEQDGIAVGTLNDVSIGEDGLVTATFSNGETRAVGKLAMANFSNPAGLKQRGDARWSVTGESGVAQIGVAGDDGFGRVQSGALERANVDITEELVALISAQRNFQANAKAIETGNQMTQSIINMRS
jgi:flagellar hook protein FlgE